MGALHEGHRTLVRAARERAAQRRRLGLRQPDPVRSRRGLRPLPAHLGRRPRGAGRGGRRRGLPPAGRRGLPARARSGVTVDPGPLGSVLEGAVRPGHFAGVLTVVAKLFGLVRPGPRALRREGLPAAHPDPRHGPGARAAASRWSGVPTVREDDGLALSSRNRYLDPEQRAAAAAISAALRAGAAAGPRRRRRRAGRRPRRARRRAPTLLQDYLELTDTDLGPAPAAGPARLLVAVRAGSTRLLDNAAVTLGETPDDAHDAQVQDPPRHGHPGRPALRGLGDRRRGPPRRRRPAARRAGRDRRHHQRRPAGDLRHPRRARHRRHRHQRRRRAPGAPRRPGHPDQLRR